MSVNPDRVLKEEKRRHGIDSSFLYEFSVEKYNSSKPFDLGLTWKSPIMWSSRQAPLHASRFFMGSENERGAIAILLKSTDELDAVPWMLKVLVMDVSCMLIFSKLSLGISGYIIILSSCLWMIN